MSFDIDNIFDEGLAYKKNGGTKLDVLVSDAIYLGGLHGERQHEPFVAVGPDDWEGDEELTFFKSKDEVDAFIEKLQEASRKAFGGKDDTL